MQKQTQFAFDALLKTALLGFRRKCFHLGQFLAGKFCAARQTVPPEVVFRCSVQTTVCAVSRSPPPRVSRFQIIFCFGKLIPLIHLIHLDKKLPDILFLTKLPDVDYKPLDPTALRLPAPQPPSERLLAAVEAFYSPPSHERPRNRSVLQKHIQ